MLWQAETRAELESEDLAADLKFVRWGGGERSAGPNVCREAAGWRKLQVLLVSL